MLHFYHYYIIISSLFHHYFIIISSLFHHILITALLSCIHHVSPSLSLFLSLVLLSRLLRVRLRDRECDLLIWREHSQWCVCVCMCICMLACLSVYSYECVCTCYCHRDSNSIDTPLRVFPPDMQIALSVSQSFPKKS